MSVTNKTLRTGAAAVLLLAGVTASAQGDVGSGPGFGLGGERGIQIRGNVVCSGCTLAEAKLGNPNDFQLYQFTHKQGRLVMRVNWVSNASRWHRIVWPSRLWVRGEDSLLQQLNAEANLFKELEITGFLNHTSALDITDVTIKG
jgi:hypothetical protein